jgi:hypothetical protein
MSKLFTNILLRPESREKFRIIPAVACGIVVALSLWNINKPLQ